MQTVGETDMLALDCFFLVVLQQAEEAINPLAEMGLTVARSAKSLKERTKMG